MAPSVTQQTTWRGKRAARAAVYEGGRMRTRERPMGPNVTWRAWAALVTTTRVERRLLGGAVPGSTGGSLRMVPTLQAGVEDSTSP